MTPLDPPQTSAGLMSGLSIPRNEAAWVRFVAEYRGYTEATCRRAGLQPADVDEVTGRVFAALVRAFPDFRYDPAKRFRGYLTRVIANAVSTYRRECRAKPGVVGDGGGGLGELPVPGREGFDPDGLAGELEDRLRTGFTLLGRVMDAARRAVDPDTWAAFQRTAVDGCDAAAVAAELGKSVGAVYMAKSRTLRILRREMARATGRPDEGTEDSWTPARPTTDSD